MTVLASAHTLHSSTISSSFSIPISRLQSFPSQKKYYHFLCERDTKINAVCAVQRNTPSFGFLSFWLLLPKVCPRPKTNAVHDTSAMNLGLKKKTYKERSFHLFPFFISLHISGGGRMFGLAAPCPMT